MKDAKQLLAEALRLEPGRIGDGTTMHDLAQWDSLAHMELVALVEAEIGDLSMDEILSMTSVAALAEILAGKRGSA